MQYIIIVVVGVFFMVKCSSDDVSTAPINPCNKDMAGVHARNAVKENLRSPSTADFPWSLGSIVELESCRYLVGSYVDAQNGFGATVRQNYYVDIKFENGKWEVLGLEFR